MRAEDWEIEAGNDARVTELKTYHGTERGAVRAFMRRMRELRDDETVILLRRPGCRPLRYITRSEHD